MTSNTLAIALTLALASTAAAQGVEAGRPTAVATLAERAPVLDGRDDDAVWRVAVPVAGFRVFDPTEDGEPAFRTEARVGYDARDLYVFVRAFDPHPDSLLRLLSRRDVRTASDQIKVMVDSYHDRRTGYEFAVNPAGVKRDYYTFDDSQEDGSWDAVWDVATRVDSAGWTAEFRIPLSQLHFDRGGSPTFGLMITREVARLNERDAWPVYRRSRPGIASQFGDLAGLAGLAVPRRLEATPYALSRNVSSLGSAGYGRAQRQTICGDVKYGVTSNLTLDVTVNPDFGQVEADPATLNLTAFETFFEERRPFFVEGSGAFQFDRDAVQLFYPRRVGRAPQLAGLVSDPLVEVPGASSILGAAKLTGRTAGGASLGAIAAVTNRERAGGLTVEPRTEYGVVRAAQDFRGGESGVGAMATVVHRDLTDATAPYLRRDAAVAGLDGRHRFAGGRFRVTGSIAASTVRGDAAAIARTQRSSTHLFQRADDDLAYDPTRTALSGTALSASADRVAGAVRGGVAYQRLSPGFEPNDAGFLGQANQQTARGYVTALSLRPHAFWNGADATLSLVNQFTAAGMRTAQVPELDLDATLRDGRTLSLATWVDNAGAVYCDLCARGGPALRLSPAASSLFNYAGDPRRAIRPSFAAIYTVGDGGRSALWRVRPYVTVRSRSNLSWELGTRYQRNRDNTQFYGVDAADDGSHYLFARLDQHLLSFTGRLDYTASPTLSLQLYAEPFVTTGRYAAVRELARSRAAAYDARFAPYDAGPADAFNEKQFHSNAVLRWEYRPGSALFVVWAQGRDQTDRDPGSFAPTRDYRNLFGARPDNTLLVKASYWVSL